MKRRELILRSSATIGAGIIAGCMEKLNRGSTTTTTTTSATSTTKSTGSVVVVNHRSEPVSATIHITKDGSNILEKSISIEPGADGYTTFENVLQTDGNYNVVVDVENGMQKLKTIEYELDWSAIQISFTSSDILIGLIAP